MNNGEWFTLMLFFGGLIWQMCRVYNENIELKEKIKNGI